MKKKHTKYRVSHRFDPTLTPCTFLNYQTLENVSQVVFLQHMCSSRLCYNFGQISFWFYIICNSLLKNMYFTVSRLVLCILFLYFWLTRKALLQPAPDWSIRNKSLSSSQKKLLTFLFHIIITWVVDLGSNLSSWLLAEVMFLVSITNEGKSCTTNIVPTVKQTHFTTFIKDLLKCTSIQVYNYFKFTTMHGTVLWMTGTLLKRVSYR